MYIIRYTMWNAMKNMSILYLKRLAVKNRKDTEYLCRQVAKDSLEL